MNYVFLLRQPGIEFINGQITFSFNLLSINKSSVIMNRLSEEQVSSIKKMANKGHSLTQISNNLNINKSTVYYWSRKEIGKKIKPLKIDLSNDFNIGQLIGAFAGDGNFYLDKKSNKYRTTFYTGSYEEEYADSLNKLIFNIFGKRPCITKRLNVILNTIYRKGVFELLKNYLEWFKTKGQTVCLRNKPLGYPPDFLKGFIRGLFDTDGNVNKKKAQLMIGSISENIILQASQILNFLNIKHSLCKFKRKENRKTLHCVYVYGKTNLQRFYKIIGSSNPYKKRIIEKVMR